MGEISVAIHVINEEENVRKCLEVVFDQFLKFNEVRKIND